MGPLIKQPRNKLLLSSIFLPNLFSAPDLYIDTRTRTGCPMSIGISENLKSKNSSLAYFWSENDYFSSRWCKIVQILVKIFVFIYLRSYLQKNVKVESDKYEIWCVVQVGRAEKKSSQLHFCQSMEQISSKYFLPIFSSNKYLARFLLANSTGPQHIHHILFFLIELLMVLL